MKRFKRNAVVITVLMFVCLAVYLNWAYNQKQDAAKVSAEADVEAQTDVEQTGLFYSEKDGEKAEENVESQSGEKAENEDAQNSQTQTTKTMAEYFDSVRLSRSQARDAAVSTLTMVSQFDTAQQQTVDEALKKISTMAEYSALESEVESLILAKGFADCVVYISDEGMNVTVAAGDEGLSSADVARITDVVTANTDIPVSNLKITEVK